MAKDLFAFHLNTSILCKLQQDETFTRMFAGAPVEQQAALLLTNFSLHSTRVCPLNIEHTQVQCDNLSRGLKQSDKRKGDS